MLGFQETRKRYKQLQEIYRKSKNEHMKEIRAKNKEIDELKFKIVKLNEEIEERSKLIREKNVLLGNLLKRRWVLSIL